MGTTLTAVQGDDSVQICFVVAIEGYQYLLTDYRTPSALFTSSTGWHGTEWSSALGGLSMQGVLFESKITPWDNRIMGNDVQFSVMDADGDDTFGKAVFKRGAGDETVLTASLNCSSTSNIAVKDTTNFASSGAAYIGCEQIAYTGKTSTTLTGISRGKYSPFSTKDGSRIGRTHTLNTKMGTVPVPIKITDEPRVWMGKWVGIWMHRVVGGVLDTKANAVLVHAGKIEHFQDSSNGNTVVGVKGLLNVISESTIFYDGWKARVKKAYTSGMTSG